MRARRALLLAPLCAVALAPFGSGCSSDEGTGPSSALIGTWRATSFTVLGQDFIAQGMALTITLAASGTYTFVVTGDLIGACSPDPSCTETGAYTYTATHITIDPGTADEVIFAYTIQGTTLTFSGLIDGNPTTITLTKA